jgi:hypothetical protein
LEFLQHVFDTFLEAKALSVEFTHSNTIFTVCCIGVKSRAHVMWFCIWVHGKRLGDNVEEGVRPFKVSRNGSELCRRVWRFFIRRFAELKRLWPELIERIIQGLKSVSEVPNPSQEAFTLGEFLCGLFSAINAPAESFDVLIEPVDKLLACEARYSPTIGSRTGWSFNSEDARARRSETAEGGSERPARIMCRAREARGVMGRRDCLPLPFVDL